jgi:hypothetical protein
VGKSQKPSAFLFPKSLTSRRSAGGGGIMGVPSAVSRGQSQGAGHAATFLLGRQIGRRSKEAEARSKKGYTAFRSPKGGPCHNIAYGFKELLLAGRFRNYALFTAQQGNHYAMLQSSCSTSAVLASNYQ